KAPPSAGKPGDLISVSCGNGGQTGILLPSINPGTIAIKLSSGYNIGIKKESIRGIEVIETGKPPSSAAQVRPQPAPKKDFIAILGCGGTIVNKIDYRTGAVYPSTSPAELIQSFPALEKFNLRATTLFSVASEDMSPSHWIEIANAVSEEIKSGAKGVVLTHGTDIMHYTSAALSFMLQGLGCPIVLTGSQRSSDRGSSDSEGNLHGAVVSAASNLSGVFICMHENISDETCLLHFGAKVRKMHTSRRDAFRSISSPPAARIFLGSEKVEQISALCKPRKGGASHTLDTRLNQNVAMQYIYPGIKPQAISALSGYDGVVLVGFGLGHLPVNLAGNPLSRSILPEVKSLIGSGIPVVFASQTIHGRVNMLVYSNQRALLEAGVIGQMCDMTPETAYVKLMWVLAREKKMGRIREMMEKNIAGEISERSEIVDFDF
ncbi:MAG: Glu-tRNA(Gln) amidotransferase subunit GatD, partial [Candidatus Micrarchaeota archaeon]|nr:Glu-tRNA(Gln) amidotransferase subunit GatD [Candidatus Micrarchaeota archaeon]